jgi:2-polyprenyl-3-methyl-5-hydroxy-6-metoxy-1,4-benzoquinol methylase
MRRTLEKLAHQKKEKQDAFLKELDELKKKSRELPSSANTLRLKHLLSRLQEIASSKDISSEIYHQQVAQTLIEFQKTLEKHIAQTQELFASIANLIEANIALMDAKDKEWDALGSNHVGMIFKSMEWRVDKLAVAYKDVNLLMKKFFHLKEQLARLLGVLEEKNLPTQKQIHRILQPLEDWHYAAFENRHRGDEEAVKNQQSQFLAYFQGQGKVLDLGCGRGEFLELCQENGIAAQGIDLNEQMVAICRDRGLDCHTGDFLEVLAETHDDTLGGIFSSQVIEHLLPSQLKKLIELSYFKLASGGHIVLETINPASVFALVQIYFLDLTHQKPIHPQTLKFMLESSGFADVEIKYSQPLENEQLQTLPGGDERASILNRNIDNLNDLLYAPLNYAAIGLKK